MLDKIKKAIMYNPETGIFTRLSKHSDKAYMHPNANGAPRITVLGKEYAARHLAWYIMTGYYPGRFEIKSLDGNLSNIKWSNLYVTKEGHKFCSKCNIEKPLTDYATNKSRKAGHEPVCKECKKPASRRYARKTGLKKFGITIEEYESLSQEQNNACAICKKEEINKSLAVDHCHASGKIRGLLCAKCNQALGLFNDDIKTLNTAIEYLTCSKNFQG